MELIKNISMVIGMITGVLTLLTIVIKPLRKALVGFINSNAAPKEMEIQMQAFHTLLQKHIDDDESRTKKTEAIIKDLGLDAKVNKAFLILYSRNLVRSMFYNYMDGKKLPLYEKKTLIAIEELYVEQLHGNSDTKFLIETMKKWEIDYDNNKETKEDL